MSEFFVSPWSAGLGLRSKYYHDILTTDHACTWFELTPENFFCDHSLLEPFRDRYPLSLHGVAMSLGGDHNLVPYLTKLARLIDYLEPRAISEHLCWCTQGQHYLPDLLPLPYTLEAVDHLVQRIRFVQQFLGTRILVENLSYYLTYQHSVMTEWEFLREIALQADCYILLDINNIYVSSQNCGFDPLTYLQAIPADRVQEYHLAGYEQKDTHILDTHSRVIQEPVWHLYEQAISCIGARPTLIEWDHDLPSFEVLCQQARHAEHLLQRSCHAVV